MSQSTFSLTYEGGFREGFDADAVRERVTQVLHLSEAQAAKLFSGGFVVLRHGLNEDDAVRYCARLNAMGMSVKVRHEPETALADPGGRREPELVATTPAAAGKRVEDGDAQLVPFEFRGDGAEYFRIWIVNILLTIVTLGVYSAWAKVRTQRYFYGNTRLDGSAFEYLADPVKILKGRAIAFALLLAYLFSDYFSPALGVAAFLLFMLALPWIVRQGLAFRNHNSAWRGVRFGFDGTLGDAYRAWLLWPVLGMLSLGLLMPFAYARQVRYAVGGSRFGTARFGFYGNTARVYMIFLAAGATIVATVVLSMLLGLAFPLLMFVVAGLGYVLAYAIFRALTTNYRFNNARLAGHLFEANYDVSSYARLVLVNTVLTVCTLGLFYPWAKVRTARYAAEHTRVVADGDLASFVAARQADQSATGGEIGELFDVDLGF